MPFASKGWLCENTMQHFSTAMSACDGVAVAFMY